MSKWLFAGQLAASGGFTVYSYLVRNWVFVATNLLMAVAAVVGLAIVLHHRRRLRRAAAAVTPRLGVPPASRSDRRAV